MTKEIIWNSSLLIFGVFIVLVFTMNEMNLDDSMNNFYAQMFPIQPMKKEISELRKVGMFKLHSDKSDEFVTQLVIGRAISKQDGWVNFADY